MPKKDRAYWISCLESPDASIRDQAALKLGDLGAVEAVEPLLRSIMNPAHVGYTGTMVYALQAMDCSGQFLPLLELIIDGSYEVQSSALIIYREQSTKICELEIEAAKSRLANCTWLGQLSREQSRRLLDELITILDRRAV